jgi:tetratricopeptide (TPR) repeat protein
MRMNGRHDSSSRDSLRRTEPVLGNLDHVDTGVDRRAGMRVEGAAPRPPFAGHRDRDHAPRRHRRMPWVTIAIVLVLAGAGAWAWSHQTMLRGLLPQTRLNTLLTRADTALAAGKLTGSADSARDLYEAARALDPDNEQALNGLQKVGNVELARAKVALQRRDYSDARAALEEARSLLGGGARVQAVDDALAKAVLHSANVDVLIGLARAALANGRIDGRDGAAALFGKVLAGDPHNAVARHGMDRIGDLLSNRVQALLGSNDRVGAGKALSDLASLLPGYSQLPSLRALVAAADRAADSQRDRYLARGEADLRAGKVAGSGDDNAEAQFKAALAADPGNARAQAGLGRVAEALIVQANAAFDAGHAEDAKALLDQAAMLAPKSADLVAARSRLAAGDTHPAAVPSASAATLTPAQAAKVARLLARARAAASKGDIMLPPGNSAYDLYQAALGIDGNDANAQAGLRALPQTTREQFRQALHNGNLEHAGDMLATLEQLDPGDPAAATMRHRLGSAWLDRADHDAMLGRTAAARTAVQQAQQLVPQDPRISEVDARIRRDD